MDEYEKMHRAYIARMEEEMHKQLLAHKDTIDMFKDNMKQKGILLDHGHFKYYPPIGIVLEYPNILSHYNSDLITNKSGLYSLKQLCDDHGYTIGESGFLRGKDHILMATHYFRRGFGKTNNFAPDFIYLLWKTNLNPDLEILVSLDEDRLRLNMSHHMYVECDKHYGAEFNLKIEDISDSLVKLCPPLDIEKANVASLFSNCETLDISWYTTTEAKVFVAEEIKNQKTCLDIAGQPIYPARYMHAEYDLHRKSFRHFDGAIHFYNESDYQSRRTSNLNYNAKSNQHIKALSKKIFEINGNLSVDDWVELSSHFLHGNPLIHEYFSGKYPQNTAKTLEVIRQQEVTNREE